MQELKTYFSGKRKLYGYKFELTVRSNGIVSWFCKRYSVEQPELVMMQGSPTRQKARLGKRDSEHEYEYEYMISDKYPAQ